MWIYVVTSFTRYNKVGREAEKVFRRALLKDGFYHLHANLFVRYCATGSNAVVHRERVRRLIPEKGCDISIIVCPDSRERDTYHSLGRRRKNRIAYDKPLMVELF